MKGQRKQVNIVLVALLCLLWPVPVEIRAAENENGPLPGDSLPVALLSVDDPQPMDSGLLRLINPDHLLTPDAHPEKLMNINGYLIRPEAGSAFLKMHENMEADGINNLRLQSAYRPYPYQRVLFEDKVKALCGLGYAEAEARELAAGAVAVPGASEHQTGLAVDVSVSGELNVEFGDTEAGVWLRNNSGRYGFIVRYPKDKVEITRIMYEPWHLRYVGVPHGEYMREHNLCLEEYIAHVKAAEAVLYWVDAGSYYKVRYVAEVSGEGMSKEMGSAGLWDVSSIGPDGGMGYIVTEVGRFAR